MHNRTQFALLCLISIAIAGCDEGIPGPKGDPGATGEQGPPGESSEVPDASTPDTGTNGMPDTGNAEDVSPDTTKPPVCPTWTAPAGLRGAVDAEVSVAMAERWKAFRGEREQERLLEAYDPSQVIARYRIEQKAIDDGCITSDQLIDVGRGLFLRTFTLEEGLGNGLAEIPDAPAGPNPRPNMRRLQQGHFGGPDAVSCANCHWKGGFAGAGDRSDNMFILGDGDTITTHDARNPPVLWGAGWIERVADEMTQELHAQRQSAQRQAEETNGPVTVELKAQDVFFGAITAQPAEDGSIVFDTSAVVGVDPDLIIKPFGWKGVFPTLRSFVRSSLQIHMNLQAEELIAAPDDVTDLGPGLDPNDPDNDTILREITEGQITALVAFLATLDAPLVEVPVENGLGGPPYSGEFNMVASQEMTFRWLDGAGIFEAIDCVSCHVPYMTVSNAVYRTQAALSGSTTTLDLAQHAANPQPKRRDDGAWLIPVFSDFKRHRMGDLLRGQHSERGVEADTYMTRRLWGLSGSSPYLHDGSATLLDEAIAMHGGEGSEAKPQADAFLALSEHDKASLRVFLLSLRRAPSIRIR